MGGRGTEENGAGQEKRSQGAEEQRRAPHCPAPVRLARPGDVRAAAWAQSPGHLVPGVSPTAPTALVVEGSAGAWRGCGRAYRWHRRRALRSRDSWLRLRACKLGGAAPVVSPGGRGSGTREELAG